MKNNEIKRLPRLTAILIQLQTKRLLTSSGLAARFSVSVRTIYRDINALLQEGVPILTEDGKGYMLMQGYRIPPVMFTESEANALVLAEQLVLKNKDASFVKNYSDAIDKIKAVLSQSTKDKANLLAERTRYDQNVNSEKSSTNLSELQYALTNCTLAKIEYVNEANRSSTRFIESFAILNTHENWLLIAWCRSSKEFRFFRLDRIRKLHLLDEKFTPHQMTLQEYFDRHH